LKPSRFTFIIAGILFAVVWSSASVATKLGLGVAQPFVIAVTRFFIGGSLMLLIAHSGLKKRLPQGAEWRKIAIYGLLNIAIYLGLYVVAMQNVSAGLGSLSIGTNPVFISLLTALWLRQRIRVSTILSLLLCTTGIVIAAWPLLQHSYATPAGLTLLLTSMLSYSVASLFFSRTDWKDLHILTINGWQTLIGGAMLLPVLVLTYDGTKNDFNGVWLGAVLWLAIPVSIGAVQLWLWLLRTDALRASFWLYLCPISGFAIAALAMHEPITRYTVLGVAIVLAGLYLVQRTR
jgi:drug/metabolite transporter (DMT)-like permease